MAGERMFGRRVSFWVAAGGASVLTAFLLQLGAARLPWPGLQKFVTFTYNGGGAS